MVANFKLVSVSLRCASSGLAITNISVFELPPSEYCRRYVNYTGGDVSACLMDTAGGSNTRLGIAVRDVTALAALTQSPDHVT